jgi:HlyD family secretion protein
MKTWTKRAFAGTVFIVLIVTGIYLAWVGLKREKPEEALEQPPTPVTVLQLEKRDFTITSRYSSRLEAISDVTVPAKVRGTVIEDHIKEGQKVSKGQVLYRLDDDSYKYAMLQAEAAVSLARENLRKVQNISRPEEIGRLRALAAEADAGLEKARSDAARYNDLYREGAVSLSQKESADLAFTAAEARADVARENLNQGLTGAREEDVSSAEAALQQAQAAYELAKDTWEDATIRSPISGIVSSKEIFKGDTLEIGMTVCNVVDLSSFRIILGVPGTEVGNIHTGQTVSVSVGDIPEEYEAAIEDVGVKADEKTGNFPVILNLSNKSANGKNRLLRAGMDVKVNIILKRIRDTIVIPTSSLLRETKAAAVFVVQDSTAHKRVIGIDASNGIEASVYTGLKPGERLVIVGQHLLKTGDKVEAALAK